jgi:hypothetical protein
MATVNLGSIKFKWKGTYNGATAYTIDDVVEYNGSSYICVSNSTGNLPTNATYFEQMSQAGTNGTDGTDLGTTLTTQGDIVYRDASGLARLGAGTSGQALITNGTGANPSWGDVSSGVDLIAEGSFSSVAEMVFTNSLWDSTKYRFHEIYIRVKNDSTNSGNGYIRYSADGGSSYLTTAHSSHGWEFNSAGATPNSTRSGDNASDSIIAGDGIGTEYGSLWLTWGGLNTAEQKQFESVWVRPNHDATYRLKANHHYGLVDTSSTSSTFKITGFTSTPAFTGTYKIFGRK